MMVVNQSLKMSYLLSLSATVTVKCCKLVTGRTASVMWWKHQKLASLRVCD